MKSRLIALLLAIIVALSGAEAAPNLWETVDSAPQEFVEQRTDDPFEAKAMNGYVYIVVRQPMTFQLYTILGQLITSKQLAVGTHRLRLSTHGVFLLKGGNHTRRITL